MDVRDAVAMAEGLLAEHGLDGWGVVLDRAKTRAGVCRPARREIGLSGPLTLLHEPAEVRDTVLHEIAHALVGTAHGHDAVWRAAARRIGCSGERTTSAPAPRGPWTGTCPAGHTSTRHRRPSRVAACGRCGPTFSTANLFTWTFAGREVPPEQLGEGYRAQWRLLQNGEVQAPHPTLLAVGTPVQLRGGGPDAGTIGTILKRGRTRYHLQTRTGVLTAPFALVEPCRPSTSDAARSVR